MQENNSGQMALETRQTIKGLAQKYADEWNCRYPNKAFMKWDDYWATACTAYDYFTKLAAPSSTPQSSVEGMKKLFDKNGFDFDAFEYENEFSAKAIIAAMQEYGNQLVGDKERDLKDIIKQMTFDFAVKIQEKDKEVEYWKALAIATDNAYISYRKWVLLGERDDPEGTGLPQAEAYSQYSIDRDKYEQLKNQTP